MQIKKFKAMDMVKVLTIITLLSYISSFVFDIGVTLTVYALEPKAFYNFESNKAFVEGMRNGNAQFSFPIIYGILVAVILSFTLMLYCKYENTITAIAYSLVMLITIKHTFGHFRAGMAWWNI